MTDAHFDAVAGHLRATLEDLGIDDSLRDVVLALVGGTREEVMGR